MWSVNSGECTAELREHDHVIECVAWAPETSHQNICAAGGIEVIVSFAFKFNFNDFFSLVS